MNICAWGSVAASLIILLLGLVAWKDWRAHRRWLREQDLRLKHGEAEDEDEDGITVTATSDLPTQTGSEL